MPQFYRMGAIKQNSKLKVALPFECYGGVGKIKSASREKIASILFLLKRGRLAVSRMQKDVYLKKIVSGALYM